MYELSTISNFTDVHTRAVLIKTGVLEEYEIRRPDDIHCVIIVIGGCTVAMGLTRVVVVIDGNWQLLGVLHFKFPDELHDEGGVGL